MFWAFFVVKGITMSEQILNTIQSLTTALIPAIVTIITYVCQSSQAKRHAAKQSILQMIMEDQLNWELFHKFPTNWGDVQNEYAIYHKNGGNGEVTKRVNDYNDWYLGVEQSLVNSKGGKK